LGLTAPKVSKIFCWLGRAVTARRIWVPTCKHGALGRTVGRGRRRWAGKEWLRAGVSGAQVTTELAASHGAETSITFARVMSHVAQGFEVLGVAALVVGVVWSITLAVLTWRRSGSGEQALGALRRGFGASLLLGLEVLVAADLIRTIAVEPSVTNVLVLGLIVLIRTFLSFSLETEIEGVLPWQRATTTGVGQLARATTAVTRPRPDS
jgi:uncharacterized membrane protein